MPADDTRRDLFDYKHGSLVGVPGVIRAKATPLRVSQPLTGDVQTFIIETFRQRDEPAGKDDRSAASSRFHVFIEYTDRDRHVRLYLPPEVASCIARQRDSLIGRSRKNAARAAAADRKARGIEPAFLKGKRRQKGK